MDKHYLVYLKGKTWVDGVRVCLIKKLHPLLSHPALTCNKLNEVAFKVRFFYDGLSNSFKVPLNLNLKYS